MSPRKQPAKRVASSPSEWTVGIYMVGGPELEPSIARDLVELEQAGSSADVKVVVGYQRRPSSSATWYEIPPLDGTERARKKKVGTSTNGSDPSARSRSRIDANLTEFLELIGDQYPAKRYLLMLWGHASGLGFGGLTPGDTGDQARLTDLREVLTTLRKRRSQDLKLEILAFCACAVNKADYALELRQEVQYLIASQVGISTLMTWPFDETVKLLLMSPSVETHSLARQLVQVYETGYEPPPVAMTALELGKVDVVGKQIDALSKSILAALDQPGPQGRINNMLVALTFDEAMDSYPWDVEPLVDLFDFCRKLAQKPLLDEGVRERAREVLDQGFRNLVVHNARSGPKFGALNGLSMLAPDFDDPDFLENYLAPQNIDNYVWSQTKWTTVTLRVYEFFTANKGLFE
jgi:hypothetical protein